MLNALESAQVAEEAAAVTKEVDATKTADVQTPEQKSLMKVVKAVGDIDRLCSISNISVDEALTAFAVITAIKLAEFDRAKSVKWQSYFDRECKHQRKLQLQKPLPQEEVQMPNPVNEDVAKAAIDAGGL